jgi:CheY-like chemotaxis protein
MTDTAIVPIWVIDDEPRNLRQVVETFRMLPLDGIEVVTFADARLAMAEYASLLEAAAPDAVAIPRIVFMDYFLGGIYGNEVTDRFRVLHREAVARGATVPAPVIIAHSSTRNGSLAIMQAGGDFILAKEPGAAMSMAITREFSNDADVERILRLRS